MDCPEKSMNRTKGSSALQQTCQKFGGVAFKNSPIASMLGEKREARPRRLVPVVKNSASPKAAVVVNHASCDAFFVSWH